MASERIEVLFQQAADKASEGDVESASDRVRRAHAIALRNNVIVPKEFQLRYCRKCLTYLTSENSRRRLNPREHRMEVKCLACGHTRYLPYARERKKS